MATKLTIQEKQIAKDLGVSEADFAATADRNASRAARAHEDDEAPLHAPADVEFARVAGVTVEAFRSTRASIGRKRRIVRADVDAPPADEDASSAPPGDRDDTPTKPCPMCAKNAQRLAECGALMSEVLNGLGGISSHMHAMSGGDPDELAAQVAAHRRTRLTRA